MSYDDAEVNRLRRRLWATAYRFARELRVKGKALSGHELLMAIEHMRVETIHHWIEDGKDWADILARKETYG